MKKIILLLLMSLFSFSGYSQLLEGFEAATTPDAAGNWNLGTAPASGVWKVFDNGVNTTQSWGPVISPPSPAALVHTGSRAADVQRGFNGQGNTSEDWLVTPLQNIVIGKQLRFFTRQGLIGDQGTIYQVRISNNNPSAVDQSNPALFPTILQTYTEQELNEGFAFSDYNEKVISLSAYAGQNRYIAFVKVFTQTGTGVSGDRWLIDDVRIVDQCNNPSVLTATNISCNSALLDWTGPTGANFEIEYGVQGFVQGSGTIVTSAISEYQLNGLDGLTCYQYYVRSICGATGNTVNSDWVGPFTFCTISQGSVCICPLIIPQFPYSTTSNTSIYGNNITNTTPGNTGCGTTGNFLGGNDVVYSFTPTFTGNISISMDPGSVINTGIFVYSSCATIGTSCLAGIGNSNSNIRVISPFAVTAGTTYYIVISSTTASSGFAYNLILQEVTCVPPTNLTASNLGLTDGTLTWQNGTGSTSTAWQVAVQTAGSPIPAGAGFLVTGTPTVSAATANGAPLVSGTGYQYWVRADCGNGVFSQWSGPFLFNTNICETSQQCTYNFILRDSGNNGWQGATMQVRQNGIVVATLGSQIATGGGPITVPVQICTGVPFDLFWNNAGTNAAQIRVQITNNFAQTLYNLNTASAALAGTVLYSQATVDCANALCLPPTGLGVTAITTNGATINWTTSGNATIGWGLYVVPVGSPAPSAGTPPTYTVLLPETPPKVLSDLLADTAYSVYIQTICSVVTPSDWTTTPVNFTTLPTCPKPTNIQVPVATINTTSAVVTFTPGAITQTEWQYVVVPSPSAGPPAQDSPLWTTVSTTSFPVTGLTAATTYVVYIRSKCGTDIGAPQVPGITFNTTICDAADRCNYVFRMRDSAANGWNGARMEISQNGILVATIGSTFNNGAGPIDITVPLCNNLPFQLKWTVAGTQPAQVGVEVINSFNQPLFTLPYQSAALVNTVIYTGTVDCLIPYCQAPSGLAYVANSATTTTATVTWTTSGLTTNGWNLYVVPVGLPAPVAGATPTFVVPLATPPPYVITGLTPDVSYNVYISTNCPGNGPSEIVGPIVVTALATCPRVTNVLVPAATVGTTTAPASFVPGNASQTAWQYAVVPAGSTAPPQNSPLWIDTATTNITLTGLTAATCYVLYVRAVCDGGADIGFPQDPGTAFCTATCEASERCNYTFRLRDSFGDGWSGTQFEVRQNGIVVATLGATFTNGNGPINVIVPLCDTLPFELVWTVGGNFSGEVGIEVINNFNQSLYTMPFQSAALVGTTLYTDTFDCMVPKCLPPTGLAQIAPITTSVATLSWDAGGQTQWILYYAAGTGNPIPTTGGITINGTPTFTTPTLPSGIYEFWVQAVCASGSISNPAGAQTFFITSVPELCAGVNIDLNTTTPGVLNLCPDQCVDLTATYTDSGDTTTYAIQPIVFAPPFPFTGGIQLPITTDDIWGTPFTLPFNFCFFGTNYATVSVGSNGVISFTPQNGNCPWATDPAVNVPNTQFPIRNAVYGVYQDINPSVSTAPIVHSINYQVVGVAPCRAFVVNYYNVAQFSCGTSVGLQTSQIVLYETSNAIEVYVQDRTSCTTWNEGSGVIGIQNAAGTVGFVPPGRSLGPWEAHNEAWRFQPAGPSNVTFGWYNGTTLISNNTTINVCATEAATYTAQAVYTGCGGVQTTTSESVQVLLGGIIADEIADVTACSYTLLPLSDFNTYYTQPGGPTGTGTIIPVGTVITTSQTIYIWAESGTDCSDESEFNVTIVGELIPVFDPIAPICLNGTAPALPTTSTNGVTGTWSAAINTTVVGTQTITFTPDATFPCSGPVEITVEIIGQLTPTFDVIPDLCLNAVAPALPMMSLEGIPGTFLPSTIVTTAPGTFPVVFTPDLTLFPCAIPVTISYTVTDQITPIFDPIADICQNTAAPVLPTTSVNGVVGTFSPSVIDTAVAGPVTITFNPDLTLSPCAVSVDLIVNVVNTIIPTFDPITSICQNATAPILPGSSNNGVTGTWSPATIDTSVLGGNDYVFTPDAGQPCAQSITITINITTPLTPDFTFSAFCANTAAPVLGTTSPNGVTGTWSPASVDNTQSGTYVFTPDAGQCALPQTVTITVTPSVTAVFNAIPAFCAGTVAPILPTTSPNGVTGTWSPATVSNTTSGTYTFTPDAQFCSGTVLLMVTVNPAITPTFAPIAGICAGEPAPILPATSLEGIPGTFSPATVSNTESGTYTFTPSSTANCETTATVDVEVIQKPRFKIDGQCQGGVYQLTAVPLDNPSNYSDGGVTYSWTGPDGTVISNNTATIFATVPGNYTLTISASGCADTQTQSAVSCFIQRGISPKGTNGGDGLNDYFDLAGQGVGKLEIFNRYGTRVYTKVNYSNEWYGQSDKGDELPDATYFYVIEYPNSPAVTGWIYINREK